MKVFLQYYLLGILLNFAVILFFKFLKLRPETKENSGTFYPAISFQFAIYSLFYYWPNIFFGLLTCWTAYSNYKTKTNTLCEFIAGGLFGISIAIFTFNKAEDVLREKTKIKTGDTD